jgi:pyruvate ferredoxin oxidoreductase alpha subunit
MKKVMEVSHAIAEAVKLCNPKLIAAYPITPQTHIVERLSEMVANGQMDCEFMNVESEHSALSVCVGAQATGIRTFTATASQGLALMHEVLFVASGMRLPIVMAIANRSLSSPLSIWCDWSDSLAERDSGWLQFYCESGQEAFDTIIQAYKISEHSKVLLPAMVCVDGFSLSHVYEPVDIPSKGLVDKFLPPYSGHVLDFDNPVTQGAWAGPDYFQEFKKQQEDAMRNAKAIIKKTNKDFFETFERKYGDGLIETYNLESARFGLITMGSLCGTIRYVLEKFEINDVGLIKVKAFRPFPGEELKEITKDLDSLGILEKDVSLGLGGILHSEIRGVVNKPISSFIGGLGGRDITVEKIREIFDIIRKGKEGTHWVD